MLTKKAGVFFLAVAIAAPARGEENAGSLRGTVRDPQGATIAGATIDIGCGNQRRRTSTSASGEFAEIGLPDGRCSVTATSEFFESETVLVDSRSGSPATLVLHVRRFSSEVVVTPTRGIEESTFNVPDAISVTSRRDFDTRPYSLLLQVLGEEPGILVQQTTSAQTSPIIRGFTGQSNVYLVDGVRLNTGAWRTGPSQYTAWIGGGAIGSIEVVRGGGSVQYGSDALGGTVQLLAAPSPLGVQSTRTHGGLEVTGASADTSLGGQADFGIELRSAMLRVGGSRRRVNDLRAGDGIDSHSVVTRFLGLPSTILGSRQIATSFNQGGAYMLADVMPGAGATLHTMFMHDSQTGVSRYDRVLGGEGLFRSGFEPQTLDFGLVRYAKPGLAILNGGVSTTFSVNRQADGRFEQSRPLARLDRQSGTTTAIGYQIQAHHDIASRHQFMSGAEFYDESTSASRELVEPSGVVTPSRPDIPDGTTYTNFGVFAQQTADVVPDRLSVRGGIRYVSFGFATEPDQALGVIAEHVTMRSTTFQASAVAAVTEAIHLTANVTRGFRAANAADMGSIGLTGGGGFEITPTRAAALGARVGSTAASDAVSTAEHVSNLRPEVVYQYEVGVKARAGLFSGAVNGFDMELFDFIQRRALVFDTDIVGTTIAGFQVVRQDAAGLAYIAQDVRPIATRVNVDRARIRGFDAEGEVRLTPSWTGSAHFSLANGRALPAGEYARRMPPPMGGAKLRWTRDRLWAEGVVTFAAEQARLNSADLSDARIGGLRTRTSIASFFNGSATDMGLVRSGVLLETGETLAQVQNRVLGAATSAPLYTTQPRFVVFGLRTGLRLTSALDVAVLAENLGDVNYRLYGSGLDAPGVNVYIRTRVRF